MDTEKAAGVTEKTDLDRQKGKQYDCYLLYKGTEMRMSYEYILQDNLENPLRYQYTAYRGAAFLQDWYMSRKLVSDQMDTDISLEDLLHIQENNTIDEAQGEWIDTEKTLRTLLGALVRKKSLTKAQRDIFDGYVKTFEVRKRLYPYYSARFKPIDEVAYHDMRLYANFACVCAAAFAYDKDMRYLNVLLKVNDTLLSQWDRRNELRAPANLKRMAYAIKSEMNFVQELYRKAVPCGGGI